MLNEPVIRSRSELCDFQAQGIVTTRRAYRKRVSGPGLAMTASLITITAAFRGWKTSGTPEDQAAGRRANRRARRKTAACGANLTPALRYNERATRGAALPRCSVSRGGL